MRSVTPRSNAAHDTAGKAVTCFGAEFCNKAQPNYSAVILSSRWCVSWDLHDPLGCAPLIIGETAFPPLICFFGLCRPCITERMRSDAYHLLCTTNKWPYQRVVKLKKIGSLVVSPQLLRKCKRGVLDLEMAGYRIGAVSHSPKRQSPASASAADRAHCSSEQISQRIPLLRAGRSG